MSSNSGERLKADAFGAETGGTPTDHDELRPSNAPTVASVAATILAVPSPSTVSEPLIRTLREPPTERRLVPGVLLGAGGMGEVYRVRDHALHRVLAMKVLQPDQTAPGVMRERFIEEAQVTAQLAHPGIPPVHEIGELDDGRPYFTMKEVPGVTLAQVIDEAHRDPLGAARWSEQRLLEIFHKVCEAVGYAHARGVAHCDLKPHNVMVGAFGEVLVMDWGVARLVEPSGAAPTGGPPVMTGGLATMDPIVAGTPAYMAPEHATGQFDKIGPRADVYALGVMLYEMLAGERPYKGTPREMVDQAKAGNVPPLPHRAGSAADDALFAIITRAMTPDPTVRYADAKPMAEDLARWREGAVRREKALATLRQAQAMVPAIEPLFDHAAELRDLALGELARLGPDASVEAKEPIWAQQDRAAELARDALLRSVEVEQLLFNALAYVPDFREAKALITELRFHRHRDAERRRAWDEAARHELVMRKHDTGAYLDYLEGRAPLTIDTEPRCLVRLHRLVRRARRLVPEYVRDLGQTPLLSVALPIGSYLLELVAPDRPPVFYPIVLRRRGGWTGVRPGDGGPFRVRIPAAGSLSAGEILVADGCCEVGGDENAPGGHRRERVWVDGFVVREHPVTFAELSAFLAERDGAPFRRMVFRDGSNVWRPDWPAVGVSWEAARAYAAWLAKTTGRPWRLPTEIEWEKAARGVDGRLYSWGDFTDPSFCHSRTIERSPRSPTSIHAFPLDASPYGVRGVGGNVRDWCVDAAGNELSERNAIAVPPPLHPGAIERVVRGGSWRQSPDAARVAARSSLVASHGYPDVGFRLVRSL
ncbi:MAG: SUMF1/EgtB/PvdO family nonheme iron enzyme [Deltaproteobacteria bacterium]|nr:SUMF1/EgtB/PvdO family nonheme iron enzyme [Deltaproteobacteria bacterium]